MKFISQLVFFKLNELKILIQGYLYFQVKNVLVYFLHFKISKTRCLKCIVMLGLS